MAFDGQRARFAVLAKARAPYPGELAALAARLANLPEPGVSLLLVAPYISQSLGRTLTSTGWSWADAEGNADVRAPGIRIQRRVTTSPPRQQRTDLPSGPGSLTIIRSLILTGVARGATATAELAGVSQPRASQILARLTDTGLVVRQGRSLWRAEQAALLDAFLASYRGPGGETFWYYSLYPPTTVARAVVEAQPAHEKLAVSGDVAADRLAPWRTPTQLTLYSTAPLRDDRLEVVAAEGVGDGNVELIVPDDPSVFSGDDAISIAHPTQVVWDLHRLGGSDRLEAAERVRAWIFDH